MRPLQFLLVLAFFVILPVSLTCLSLLQRAKASSEPLGPGFQPKNGHLRSWFSFTTPSSLFPQSAVISLTNDNSTFFLSRPAAFGPGLPSDGLSAQLWVGKGFGEEISLNREDIRVNGYELGCSDVPGWDDEHKQKIENGALKSDSSRQNAADDLALPSKPGPASPRYDPKLSRSDVQKSTPDGTDDHLHRPLRDSNPAGRTKPGEPADAVPNTGKSTTHADIESLQESADIAGKIVMLSRGGCGFLEKVKWAQRRGGVALIVGDNQPGGQLTIMYAKGDTSNITIPSLFTSYNAAHLLSSLVPLVKKEDGTESFDSTKSRGHNKSGRTGAGSSMTKPARAKLPRPGVPQDANQGWVQNVLSAVGLDEDSSDQDDSRRPPSSGNIDWIPLDDWDENRPAMTSIASSLKAKVTSKPANTMSKAGKTKNASSKKMGNDDFVIGVQDWRDMELIAPKTTTVRTGVKTNSKQAKADSQSRPVATTKGRTASLRNPGFITPGSGEYDHQKLNSRNAKVEAGGAENHVLADDDRSVGEKVRSFFYDAPEREIVHPKPEDHAPFQAPITREGVARPDKDNKGEEEGLWLTLTPTSISTSPFFDTLLVLVVSPLVTLTVVYGLLLLRSRIRRRRWRAPKSIVERLPVRTYHTMTTSSSTTSSNVASPNLSPTASPELQATSARPRPRSQTTTGLVVSSPEKPVTKTYARRAKKYSGRQVECVVCLEEYVDGESKVMSLPCGHEFHAECITPWLVTRRRTCPICKGDVVRSLSRSMMAVGSSSSLSDEEIRSSVEETSDDVQDRAAETVDDNASAALPIPAREDIVSADDIERDAERNTLLTGTSRAQAMGWRGILGASISRLSGDTVWRNTPDEASRQEHS